MKFGDQMNELGLNPENKKVGPIEVLKEEDIGQNVMLPLSSEAAPLAGSMTTDPVKYLTDLLKELNPGKTVTYNEGESAFLVDGKSLPLDDGFASMLATGLMEHRRSIPKSASAAIPEANVSEETRLLAQSISTVVGRLKHGRSNDGADQRDAGDESGGRLPHGDKTGDPSRPEDHMPRPPIKPRPTAQEIAGAGERPGRGERVLGGDD